MRILFIVLLCLELCLCGIAQDVSKINTLIQDCVRVFDCNEGYILVKKESGWGYLDVNTLEFTRCDFQQATRFAEGYAWVLIDDQWSIFSKDGTLLKTNYSDVHPFSDGLALVKKGTYDVFVSHNGNVVISNDFEKAKPFSEGLTAACKNRRWGFINTEGKWVIYPQYQDVKCFKEGYAAVLDDNGWTYIDFNGDYLLKKHFQQVNNFNEGASIVHENFSSSMSILGIDSVFVPFYATKIGDFHEGIASYQIPVSQKYSQDEAFAIPQGKHGYLIHNKDYNPAATIQVVHTDNINRLELSQIVNSKYYTLIAPIFEDAKDFSDGYGAVRVKDKWGYVDKNGQYLCLPLFEDAKPFNEGIAQVKYKDKFFFIDTLGNGIPNELLQGLNALNIELQTQNVYCWSQDAQYEQALKESIRLYNLTTKMQDGVIPELSSQELSRAGDLILIANRSKNELVSLFDQKVNSASLYYRGIQTPQKMSFQGGSPILNIENGNKYLQNLIENEDENTSSRISELLNRKDFERAAYLLFTKDNLSPDLWEAYFYLLEVASMSMLVNRNISDITNYVDAQVIKNTPTLENAIWLCELKQYRSANEIFSKLVIEEKDVFLKALCYHNWGLACQSYGDYTSSSRYLSMAISLYKKVKDEKAQGLYLESLAALFACSKVMELKTIEKYTDEYLDAEINFTSYKLYKSDQREGNKTWEFALRRMNRFLNSLDNAESSSFITAAYIINHFKNNIQLDILSKWQKLIKECDDKEVERLIKAYSDVKETYDGLNPYSPSFTKDELCSADSVYNLEKVLKNYIFDKQGDYCNIEHYKQLPQRPKHGDVLIDIVDFSDSLGLKQYAAFVFTEEKDTPTLVKLFDSKHYGGEGDEYLEEYGRTFNFWKPLYGCFGQLNVNNIFVSFGSLSNFGWEYLRDSSSEKPYLLRTNIFRCQSLFSASENGISSCTKSNKSIAFFGDIIADQISDKRGGDGGGGKLTFSKKEIDDIASLLDDEFTMKFFLDSMSTVEHFLALDNNSPGIIHFATHGKQQMINPKWSKYSSFIKEKDDNILVEEIDWLLNSTGLQMSPSKRDDTITAILKSYQISRCNLANCDLAVMSACNTSYGISSEAYAGPMGLNYAFQMSSAKNIISTLRTIGDKDAYEFMRMFYKCCLHYDNLYFAFKETIAEAFEKNKFYTKFWSNFIFINNNI